MLLRDDLTRIGKEGDVGDRVYGGTFCGIVGGIVGGIVDGILCFVGGISCLVGDIKGVMGGNLCGMAGSMTRGISTWGLIISSIFGGNFDGIKATK